MCRKNQQPNPCCGRIGRPSFLPMCNGLTRQTWCWVNLGVNWVGDNHKAKRMSTKKTPSSWWLNQQLWKIFVKMGIFPKVRGEHKKSLKPPPSLSTLLASLRNIFQELTCSKKDIKRVYLFQTINFGSSVKFLGSYNQILNYCRPKIMGIFHNLSRNWWYLFQLAPSSLVEFELMNIGQIAGFW